MSPPFLESNNQSGSESTQRKILRDGCSRLSRTVIDGIQRNLQLENAPTAVQLQFYGSKSVGLSVLSQERCLLDFVVETSQTRIPVDPRYAEDEAKLTIDIVRPAILSTPAYLSADAIQVLAWNGVPHEAFVTLQEASFRREFSDLVDWPQDSPPMKLMVAISRLGNILASRRAWSTDGTGHGRMLAKDWDGHEDGVMNGMNLLAETCLLNLGSGFRPESLPYLEGKLRDFLTNLLIWHVDKFRIAVEYSVCAMLVPGKRAASYPAFLPQLT